MFLNQQNQLHLNSSSRVGMTSAHSPVYSPSPRQNALHSPSITPSPLQNQVSSPDIPADQVVPPVQQTQTSLKLPLSPETTIQYYRELLTPFELHEIYQYPHIYFAGAMGIDKVGSRMRRTGSIGTPNVGKEDLQNVYNYGYDDSKGDYYITPHDHVGYRYELISILGKGSFGQVAKCFDHRTKTIVALKVIKNKKRFEKQGVVEVKVLDRLRKEDKSKTHHLVHMLDSFYFRGHLCITFELLGNSLYDWVKAGGFRGVHVGVLQALTVQLLKCLSLLHRIKAVHCDLKPENILFCDTNVTNPQLCDLVPSSSSGLPRSYVDPDFDSQSPRYTVKVIDFGSSCYEHERIYTYVQSRFYRSPEVLLGIDYTSAIDMWSLGCILAELHTGYPLFPGENEQEQLSCIMELKGIPPPHIVAQGTRRKYHFEQSTGNPRPVTNSKGKKRRPGTRSLSAAVRSTDAVFLDFLDKCLEWDPERRLTPEQALGHAWLAGHAPLSSPASVDSLKGGAGSNVGVSFSMKNSQSSSSSAVGGGTSAALRSSMVSPSNVKQFFGELIAGAKGRRRELSLSNGSTVGVGSGGGVGMGKRSGTVGPLSKSASIEVVDGAGPPPPADTNTWRSSFAHWRKMGSASGPAGGVRLSAPPLQQQTDSADAGEETQSSVGVKKTLTLSHIPSEERLISQGVFAVGNHEEAPLPAIPQTGDEQLTEIGRSKIYRSPTVGPASLSKATAAQYVAPQKVKPRRLSMFQFDKGTSRASQNASHASQANLKRTPLSLSAQQSPSVTIPSQQSVTSRASTLEGSSFAPPPAVKVSFENVSIDSLAVRSSGSSSVGVSQKFGEKEVGSGSARAVTFAPTATAGVDLSVSKSMSFSKLGGMVRSMSQRKAK
ncbi:Dual specificity tyrosine-phosphorylation-regulated kinase [Chytriomyces hyalinus]|nr:Dual specificity tyrosine-phosphorylation-regulated kinase [Chytriomyces hyalinus]